MGQMNSQDMLRRLLRAKTEAEPQGQMTGGRVVRLAIARAADEALGLSLTVLGVNQEVEDLDSMVKRLSGDWMLIGLVREDELVGVAGLDLQARAAAVEMQTLGQLRSAPAAERAITPSDVALCSPLVTGFLTELEEASRDTELAGWTDGATVGARISDARAVGLALSENRYRYIGVTLDLGTGERQGTILLALPASPATEKEPEAQTGRADLFKANFQATVMEAPAILHAVLHHMTLPLSKVAKFQVGDTVPLPGVTVGSVRMEAPGGQVLGRARLGQVTGMRAVRLEVAAPATLAEVQLPDRRSAAPAAAERPEPQVIPDQRMDVE
ncbi:FliM/FliN family flagellar motor switch protein [Flavimaricola marinus]|uniref:Flagellar motor switch protein FliM n=1 Tax=Flavimaricola marinus TaxID=1819565 RepID=A0A238LIM4_9RHOB|nr:FliM/FliN family flagellar motor switch protein [Flavimaricola marinus]SMY09577.1 flagellar motor switch protein FliM [Flavimaricola marinus]